MVELGERPYSLDRLLVDDEKDAVSLIAMGHIIAEEVETVTTVRNIKGAIAAIEGKTWDIVYLDHDMGPETGMELLDWLQQNPEHLQHMDIVCVSFNPVGKQRIEAKVKDLRQVYRDWAKAN